VQVADRHRRAEIVPEPELQAAIQGRDKEPFEALLRPA
jgi:hypothetical protein